MKNYEEVMKDVKGAGKYPKIMHGVAGMLSRPEAEWLHRIPRVVGDGWYVDLGTFRGRSACLMADTIKALGLKANVFTVDTFDDRAVSRRFKKDGTLETSGPTGKDHYDLVAGTFKEKGVSDYIVMYKGTTVGAVEYFPYGCRLLFIDADHSYAAVKADFLTWKHKVNKDGFIAFHDSHRDDLVKFHAEIIDWEEFDRVDTLSVWRRK